MLTRCSPCTETKQKEKPHPKKRHHNPHEMVQLSLNVLLTTCVSTPWGFYFNSSTSNYQHYFPQKKKKKSENPNNQNPQTCKNPLQFPLSSHKGWPQDWSLPLVVTPIPCPKSASLPDSFAIHSSSLFSDWEDGCRSAPRAWVYTWTIRPSSWSSNMLETDLSPQAEGKAVVWFCYSDSYSWSHVGIP